MDPNAFVFMALSGESEHGPSSGAVFVDTKQCHAKYTVLPDIAQIDVRKNLAEQMKLHPNNLYIVNKTDEHLHVFSIRRDQALEQLKSGKLPTLTQT